MQSQPSSQPNSPTHSFSQWRKLSNVQLLPAYTGKATSNVLEESLLLGQNVCLEDSSKSMPSPLTSSEHVEDLTTMSSIVRKWNLECQPTSPSDWENYATPVDHSDSLSSLSSSSYDLESLSETLPRTPIMMSSSLDMDETYPPLSSLYLPNTEIPTSIQFVSYFSVIQERASPEKRSLVARGLMSRLLENGGTTILVNPTSYLMTLAELYVRLVSSSELLIGTRVMLNKREPPSHCLQLPLSLQRTYSRQIGGTITSLERLAAELYGDVYLAWCTSDMDIQEKSLQTHYHFTDFDPDLVI